MVSDSSEDRRDSCTDKPYSPLRNRRRGPTLLQMNTIDDYLRVCEEAVRPGARGSGLGRADRGPQERPGRSGDAGRSCLPGGGPPDVLGAFPDHCLLGEEDKARRDVPADRAEYRWIVDPLDGTTNYVHGVPHYCVSLALERNGELLVGAVFDPVLDECFTAAAARGHGSMASRSTPAASPRCPRRWPPWGFRPTSAAIRPTCGCFWKCSTAARPFAAPARRP